MKKPTPWPGKLPSLAIPRLDSDTRETFAFPVLGEGTADRRLLEFSRRNRRSREREEKDSSLKNVAEERRKKQPAGVDSGFRQEDVTVNPRPLASDEPTLSLAHGLCSLVNTRLTCVSISCCCTCPCTSFATSHANRNYGEEYVMYACVRARPPPSHRTLSSNYYHANRYVCMYVCTYAHMYRVYSLYRSYNVDGISVGRLARNLPPCFSSGSPDTQWGPE